MVPGHLMHTQNSHSGQTDKQTHRHRYKSHMFSWRRVRVIKKAQHTLSTAFHFVASFLYVTHFLKGKTYQGTFSVIIIFLKHELAGAVYKQIKSSL